MSDENLDDLYNRHMRQAFNQAMFMEEYARARQAHSGNPHQPVVVGGTKSILDQIAEAKKTLAELQTAIKKEEERIANADIVEKPTSRDLDV